MAKYLTGIGDLALFYRDRFAFNHCYDFTRHPLGPYDIENFKALWVY